MFSINNSLSFQLLVLQAKITHVVEYSVSHICDKKKKEKKKRRKRRKKISYLLCVTVHVLLYRKTARYVVRKLALTQICKYITVLFLLFVVFPTIKLLNRLRSHESCGGHEVMWRTPAFSLAVFLNFNCIAKLSIQALPREVFC